MPRRLLLALVLTATCAQAQEPVTKQMQLPPVPPVTPYVTQQLVPVSHTDLYCSGYLSDQRLGREQAVMGGVNSPNATQFRTGEFVYLRGTGYQPGTRVSLVREISDPNRLEAFDDQDKSIRRSGRIYAELGYAVIVENQGAHSVAQLEFTCEPVVTGDLVTTFVVKPAIAHRRASTVDLFPDREPAVSGRILAGRDFDQFIGSGHKVYINIGWTQGLKLGDYVKVTRGYSEDEQDRGDAASLGASAKVDVQVDPAKVGKKEYAKLPRRVVGEGIILSVGPKTATAMITFALSEIHTGDRVDVEDETQIVPPTGAAGSSK